MNQKNALIHTEGFVFLLFIPSISHPTFKAEIKALFQ